MSLKRSTVQQLLSSQELDREVLVKGWVRTRRGNKYVQFIALNDGSIIHHIQVVASAELFPE
jgi:asparaginyl-tRNA synthetase